MSNAVSKQPISTQDVAETAISSAPARSAATSPSEPHVAARPARRGLSRGSAALVLSAIALLPAAAVGSVFGSWDRTPPVAQWAVIGIGLACTAAVVYLIFTAESEEGP